MAARKQFLIITNPTSGRRRGERMSEKLAHHLEQTGSPVSVRATTPLCDAEEIANDACSDIANVPTCIVACGGDGTVQQVANAIVSVRERLNERTPVLGIAPAGRCNDFAAVLGIDKDEEKLAHTLCHGEPMPIDLGRVNGRYFCTVATLGFDAAVSEFVNGMTKIIKGMPAYLYGTLRVLARYKSHTVRLTGDFGTIERPIFCASSANTGVYGGGIRIAPSASPTDGQLDVCVIQSVSKIRGLTLLLAVLRSRHALLPEVSFHRTTKMQVDSEEPLEIWADGERVATTPATIEVVSSPVRIMLPSSRT